MKTSFDSTTAPIAGLPSAAEAEKAQLTALVQQFEGMLLTEMLRSVKQEDDDHDEGVLGLGGSSLTDTMTGEFGLSLSRAGGLGLGEMLGRALARQRGQDGDVAIEPARGGRDVPAIEPSIVPLAVPLPGVGPDSGDDPGAAAVTSEYGWRRDPFDGVARFHRGTDLRVAYGSEVKALVGGTISFAGERPGYGTTVVVDHGEGRQSLYAHLSSIAVQPGDLVVAGQEIARSGRSGRATGPHLHVEAREHGRAVDPRRLAVWAGVGQATAPIGESTSD